jgi:hypothetical protein
VSDPEEAAGYLGKLEVELTAQGMRCELVTTGYMPRLRLYIPWVYTEGWAADSAFEDHILATNEIAGRWQFWWPWIEPIGPVEDLAGAADRILRDTLETLAATLEYVAGDEPGNTTAQQQSQSAGPAAEVGCQRGACRSCGFPHALTGRLERLGLTLQTRAYPEIPEGSSGGLDEIEITNPAAPKAGTIWVSNDGLMVWETTGEPGHEHDAIKMASVIATTLSAPSETSRRSGSQRGPDPGGTLPRMDTDRAQVRRAYPGKVCAPAGPSPPDAAIGDGLPDTLTNPWRPPAAARPKPRSTA